VYPVLFFVTSSEEMIRTLQVIYQWLTRFSVIVCVSLLILLVTLVLCLANFGLIKYAVIGILAGIIFWKWPGWVRYMLGAAILIILLEACSSSENAIVLPQFNWPATYRTQIILNSSGKIWTVNEQMTVPGDALRQITEGDGQFATNLPSRRQDQYKIDIERLAQMVKPDGLTLIGVENGTDPMFSFPRQSLTHPIPVVPLVTTQTIDLPYESLSGNVNIVPGNDSSVVVTGPSAVIEATTPASMAEAATTGEERVIGAGSLSSGDTGSVSVSISTLSILARDEPMRMMAGLSLSSAISWVIAGIWGLLVVLMQTGAKAAAKSGWQRIHPTKASPDKDSTGKKEIRDKPARPQQALHQQSGKKISHDKGIRPKKAPHQSPSQPD
jgi:hypothetical protein